MIATVRIAPVERWCEETRSEAERHPRANFHAWEGQLVEIDTASMETGDFLCSGKYWQLTPESIKKLEDLCGLGSSEAGICEHMLELGD